MKQIISTLFLVMLGSALVAQDANRVVGVWLTQDGDSKITIKRDAKGKFNGEITWLKEPLNEQGKTKVDDENPDKNLRNRPILGLKLLEGFEYNQKEKRWEDGTIYDPQSGKTYKCLMWFERDPNKLSVKGYIGFSLIGREVVWTRSN